MARTRRLGGPSDLDLRAHQVRPTGDPRRKRSSRRCNRGRSGHHVPGALPRSWIQCGDHNCCLATLAALLLTGLLSLLFVNISFFTGSGSEEAAFLQISQSQVNLQGLLLASIIIGTLRVLDDVTVTQASAVWELQRANPEYGMQSLQGSHTDRARSHRIDS